MKALISSVCSIILGTVLGSLAAHGQCLPLQTLTKELADGHLSVRTLGTYLPSIEWQLHQPSAGTIYWSFVAPESNEGGTTGNPETRVELRRSNQQDQYDVVYKTAHKNCYNELRAEVRRAKLKVEPVTCLQCQAERFTAAGYTITIYNQQQGFAQGKMPYPYVFVVHSLMAPPVVK
jgi:hypothetical protein